MPNISLIVIRANNVEQTREFYQTYLGLTFEHHTNHCTPHYAAQSGEVLFEIYQSKKTVQTPDMIGFKGVNLDDILAKLPPEHVVKKPTDSQFGRFMIITDPNGRQIYLEAQK